jgi:hypothetical protein
MDAARLVAEAERAVRRSSRPEHVIAEAWQAYELTEALARSLAAHGRMAHGRTAAGRTADGPVPRGRAAGGPLADGGGRGERDGGADHGRPVVRAGPAPVVAATGAGPPRAARLTSVRDPAGTLRALRVLLGEIGLALVDLVCAAEDEGAYWQFVEALDAVDETKDRARELALTVGE